MKPKIRIKGFEDDWKLSKYDDIFSLVGDNGHNVPKTEYCERGRYPIIDQSKEFIVGYTDKATPIDETSALIVFGDHTRELKFIDFPFCTGADGTRILKTNNDSDSRFMYYVCNALKIPDTGYNRHFKYIKESKFLIPVSKSEQQAISEYFKQLDSVIASTGKKVEALKQVKAASMQSMFPQEGETTPRIRFKGFSDSWVKVPLEKICEKRASSLSENKLGPNCGSFPVYGATGYIQNIPTYQFDKPYIGIVKDGSGVGRSQLFPAFSSILGTMQCINNKTNISIGFLAALFEIIDFSPYITGSTIPHIYFKDYCNKIVSVPSLEEQQMIADYFANLDRQIALQSQRLEKLKQIKAACLDNMFV